jgi:hypothetical protein
MLFSSSFFIGTLIVVIIGSFLSAHLDVVPPIFLAGWCTFIAAIVQLMRKWEGQVRGWVGFRFPIFIVVLVLVLVLSVFDLSDNHELPFARTQKSPEKASSAFAAWLERDKSTVGPSTVFIVAAEGGGARAAYMTALALEKMRARCSAFQHRLFAVIGVSGGSVGAALSAAAAKWRPPFVGPADCSHIEAPARLAEASKKESPTVKAADTEEEPKEPAAVAAAGTDLLRPLLRGGLTLDLLMRALPGSLLQTHGVGGSKSVDRNFFQKWFDRSSYLDWRLDLAWREQASEQSIRDRLFLDVWPGLTGDVPALILLATDVSSGRRVAISHLQFSEEDIPEGNDGITCLSPFQKREEESADEAEKALSRRTRLLTTAEIAPGRDLPLLEAAFVSARFPIVTPAATLPCPRKVVVRLKNGGEKKVNTRWRLVDGGYFENSGLTTALELSSLQTQ